MYESHFDLQEAPFSLTPNTHFFMASTSHSQALEMLLIGIEHGEGFLKVTGEVGTGKSLLCRMLLNHIEDEYVTAYIPNPSCTPETLYCLISDELSDYQETTLQSHLNRHVDAYFNDSLTSEKQVLALQKIQSKLLLLAEQNKRVVLIIDEAQAMSRDTIEALRLISNLETESRKLLQIVLFAQPELDNRLQQDDLRQLAQRISFHYRLEPFGTTATEAYIRHRLHQAGARSELLFSKPALRLIARASKGIPRLINILCHKCLILSYGKGLQYVDVAQVRLAVKDTPSANQGWQALWRKPVFRPWAMIALVVPVIGVWLAQSLSILP